jgi:hypothetical protein
MENSENQDKPDAVETGNSPESNLPSQNEQIQADKLADAHNELSADLDEISDIIERDKARRKRTLKILITLLICSLLLVAGTLVYGYFVQKRRDKEARESAETVAEKKASEITDNLNNKIDENKKTINDLENAVGNNNEALAKVDSKLKSFQNILDTTYPFPSPVPSPSNNGNSNNPPDFDLVKNYVDKGLTAFKTEIKNEYVQNVNFNSQFKDNFDVNFKNKINNVTEGLVKKDDFKSLSDEVKKLREELNRLKPTPTPTPAQIPDPITDSKNCIQYKEEPLSIDEQLMQQIEAALNDGKSLSKKRGKTSAVDLDELLTPAVGALPQNFSEINKFPYLTYVVREGRAKRQKLYNLGIDIRVEGVKDGRLLGLTVYSGDKQIFPKLPPIADITILSLFKSRNINMGEQIIFSDGIYLYSLIPIYLNRRFLAKDFIGLAIARALICR